MTNCHLNRFSDGDGDGGGNVDVIAIVWSECESRAENHTRQQMPEGPGPVCERYGR